MKPIANKAAVIEKATRFLASVNAKKNHPQHGLLIEHKRIVRNSSVSVLGVQFSSPDLQAHHYESVLLQFYPKAARQVTIVTLNYEFITELNATQIQQNALSRSIGLKAQNPS